MSTWLGCGVLRHLVKRDSTCVCEDVSGWNLHLNWWTEWSRLPSPMRVGLTQSTEGLNRTKILNKWELLLPDCLSWDISLFLPSDSNGKIGFCLGSWACQLLDRKFHHWPFWFSGLQTWARQHIASPGSPACWLQILGLVSFHNCMTQFPIINLSLNTCTW